MSYVSTHANSHAILTHYGSSKRFWRDLLQFQCNNATIAMWSSWVSQVSGTTECLGGTQMVCHWCTSPCTIPNSLPWPQLLKGLEDKKRPLKILKDDAETVSKGKRWKKKRWFLDHVYCVLKTPHSPECWNRKRAVSATKTNCRSPRRWRIGSWVGWLAVSNWIPFVEIKAGGHSRHATPGTVGNCDGVIYLGRFRSTLEWQLGNGSWTLWAPSPIELTWVLKLTLVKRKITFRPSGIFQTSVFGFYVSFRGV